MLIPQNTFHEWNQNVLQNTTSTSGATMNKLKADSRGASFTNMD